VTVSRPEPGPGEVLVRTLYLSVDPYMRGRMRDAESYAEPWGVDEPMAAGVVGVAGSDEKCDWLTDELGVDAAVNYQTTDDLTAALTERCPDGVDCYFDNVGGPITDAVWGQLNRDARVAVCGQISLYNATEQPTGPRKLAQLIQTRASVEGFLVGDYQDRWGHALERLGGFIQRGALRYEETVTEGLENAPDAFLGLFEGENIGKQLVRVGEREQA